MSSEPSADSAAPGTPHPAPGLPTIRDEAADTPVWVPVLGVALFLFFGVWALMSVASYGTDGAASADGGVTDGDIADGPVSDGGTAPAN